MLVSRLITLLVLLLLALILTFGMVMSMRTDNMGQMLGCPFANGEALCQMGVFEHLARFQQAFASTPTKATALLSAVFLIRFLSDNKKKFFLQNDRLSYLRSIRDPSPIFNGFLLALSDGIVQPKIYA